MKPQRIQRRRTAGWKMPANTVYVGRGSRWGNPFRLVQVPNGRWAVKTDGTEDQGAIMTKYCRLDYETRDAAARDAVRCYAEWLLPYRHGNDLGSFFRSTAIMEDLERSIAGKNLACWCREDETCHADYLIMIANARDSR